MVLEKSGVHDNSSHQEDISKYLEFQQIAAVHNAVSVAPTLPVSVLWRNMALGGTIDPKFIRSIQRQVLKSRVLLIAAQLEGYIIGSSFGALTEFVSIFWITSLIKRHNDVSDQFHFDLFRPFVIGHDIKLERDIGHINIPSPWFICHAGRSGPADRRAGVMR